MKVITINFKDSLDIITSKMMVIDLKVISGGDGYEDFSSSASSDLAGGSKNNLKLYSIPHSLESLEQYQCN